MSKPFSLIVTDTSPLFTLVLADALDVLLRPGLAVSVPDVVYIEARRVPWSRCDGESGHSD